MANLAGTTETYNLIGLREDLTDMIYMISPTETPFLSGIGRASAKAITHEWQTDTLAAPAANQQPEGDEYTTWTEVAATRRLKNTTQISTKRFLISGTAQVVSKAGRSDEIGYQLAKHSQELKRDVEFNLTQNSVWTDGAADGTARKSAGYETWMLTNRDAIGAATVSTLGQPNESVTVTDGAQRALLESMLKNVLQQCYTSGGNPNLVMAGPRNKQNISAFSGNTTRFDRSEDMRLVTAIDVYVSDYGEVHVVPNRFQRERSVLVVDMRYWAIGFLRPFKTFDLAKTSDGDKKVVLAEFTMEARNEASSGIIADLTTT